MTSKGAPTSKTDYIAVSRDLSHSLPTIRSTLKSTRLLTPSQSRLADISSKPTHPKFTSLRNRMRRRQLRWVLRRSFSGKKTPAIFRLDKSHLLTVCQYLPLTQRSSVFIPKLQEVLRSFRRHRKTPRSSVSPTAMGPAP